MTKREDPLKIMETMAATTTGNLLLDKSQTCLKTEVPP